MNLVRIDGHDHYELDGRLIPAICGGWAGTTIATIAAWVSIAAAAVGTGLAVYQASESAAYQKKASKYNQAIADNQATEARQNAEMKAQEVRTRNRIILARARNTAYGSGLDVTPGGSLLEVLSFDAEQGELEALRTSRTGQVEAWGYEAQKRMHRFQGQQAGFAGAMNMGGSLLSGLSNTGRMAFDFYSRPRSSGNSYA